MSELIDGLLRATLWMSLGVMLLAGARPLLLKLGGPALAYRSWWLLPLLLLAVVMPLPRLSPLDGLALQVLPQLSTRASTAGHAAVDWRAVLIWLWGAGGASRWRVPWRYSGVSCARWARCNAARTAAGRQVRIPACLPW